MLIQMLSHQPRMIFSILGNTPTWVWGLLAALMALGASQCFARSAGLRRVLLMPLAMTIFSAFGLASAFGSAPHVAATLAVWLLVTCAVAALTLWLLRTPTAGVRYDAAGHRFHLPGSIVPILLILGIFLVKYGVGVALAMQPSLGQGSQLALQIALVYGVFNGIFVARAGRLLRLARSSASAQHLSPI